MRVFLLILSLILFFQFTNIAQSRKVFRRNFESSRIACNVCPNPNITQDETIYGDALNANWQVLPTSISSNISNTSPQLINLSSIKITNPTVNQLLDIRYNTIPLNTIELP